MRRERQTNQIALFPPSEEQVKPTKVAKPKPAARSNVSVVNRTVPAQPVREASVATRIATELPSFAGLTQVGIDTETTVEPFIFDRTLTGISYCTPDGRKAYVPVRHPGGGNFDVETVQRWAKSELAGKQLIVANAKHEEHTLRKFGTDPEDIGCTWMDVFHQAPLLNEKRRKTNLHLLAEEELGIKMIEAEHDTIWQMPAERAAPIAIEDVDITWKLYESYKPKIAAENLDQVLQLENDLVYSTCEMERNGSHIDVPLLLKYDRETKEELEQRIKRLSDAVGNEFNPNSPTDKAKLFRKLGIDNPYFTEGGESGEAKESFAEEVLLEFEDRDPLVTCLIEAVQLLSMRSKYILKYLSTVSDAGVIYYALHQLRSDEGGTITGRYSSGMVDKKHKIGINVQQVSKTEKMPEFLKRWPTRRLFIAPPGEIWVSSDASQIEYRMLSHYASLCKSRYTGEYMTRLAEEYRKDPNTDFHALVVGWTGLPRSYAKNTSFGKLYGAGIDTIRATINSGIKDRSKWLSRDDVERIVRKYEREFPEAAELMTMTENRARTRGYVLTTLGRRRRYEMDNPRERFYSAMNSVLQGSAADAAKVKIKRLYAERKRFGLTLRSCVHDEVNGTVPEVTPALAEFMNEQEIQLNVPVLWKTGFGPNWEDAH